MRARFYGGPLNGKEREVAYPPPPTLRFPVRPSGQLQGLRYSETMQVHVYRAANRTGAYHYDGVEG